MSQTILIEPRIHDIGGGLIVRRALPHLRARAVGPFVFLDEFGPLDVAPGGGTDVRPHPHIGLATVTYLMAGEMVHRDSLGTVQAIRPGDINLMSAGRGIVHSERGSAQAKAEGQYLHGLQTWLALPQDQAESAPWFRHYPGSSLPRVQHDGASLHVLMGRAFGVESPVQAPSPTLYVWMDVSAGSRVSLQADYAERALYVVSGGIEVDGQAVPANELAVLAAQADSFTAVVDSRVVLLGGDALDGPRHLWWNFVASSRERIEQAKQDWAAQRFPSVPDETEFIPLPEH
ncbi:hypothetical protein DFR29_11916 [Tahibacter aquaticus]|uniref:Pirin n=1 Tax=Tahibacter aquaticus TaxID=520092 RepID=A0A4R6YML3_9GAMM|nr:pirin family protein [Tahibacter aquaticus]TDR38688.1 hypothetical protein DFR29_11916 [Tahibacter aquaticus]